MSVVLLWQPSDYFDLFVIDYIFLCYSRKINMTMMMMAAPDLRYLANATIKVSNV